MSYVQQTTRITDPITQAAVRRIDNNLLSLEKRVEEVEASSASLLVTSSGVSAVTIEKDLGSIPKSNGYFTITDAAIGATSKVLCWQAPGPYTGKGSRADEAEMQPVLVTAVAPSVGSAVIYWQTPPIVVDEMILADGRRDAPAGAADPRYPFAQWNRKRIGKVKGNVKFSYVVFA